jgi:hypothetical protein
MTSIASVTHASLETTFITLPQMPTSEEFLAALSDARVIIDNINTLAFSYRQPQANRDVIALDAHANDLSFFLRQAYTTIRSFARPAGVSSEQQYNAISQQLQLTDEQRWVFWLALIDGQ